MSKPETYLLVGGPRAGQAITLQAGARRLVVPHLLPLGADMLDERWTQPVMFYDPVTLGPSGWRRLVLAPAGWSDKQVVDELLANYRPGPATPGGHTLTLEPQPIADQWMGRCACGWRETASLWDHDSGESARAAIRAAHAEHCRAQDQAEP